MEASITTQDASHIIFHIPELLIRVLIELPDKELQRTYAVSSFWSKVLKAHLPPEKLPLPDGAPSPAYKKLPWAEMTDLLQLNPALGLPGGDDSDTPHLVFSYMYSAKTMTRIPWHDWEALLYSDDPELRNMYIVTPVLPTTVEVRIEDGADFRTTWEYEDGYNDILGSELYCVPNPGCVRMERERGVRLGDMLDALRGLVAGNDCSWWFDMPDSNLNEPYDDEHIPDEYKFVEFEITMI
jgi:hypothetical protein